MRLKHARMVKQLTLKALAEQAGCSESMLSKLEGGHAQPSLATLHKIALALSTNVGALVSGPDINTSPVQRASERPMTEFPSAGKRLSIMLERVIVPAAGQLLQSDIHVIEPLASSDEQISHAGEELGYVIEGEFELTLGEECYLLHAGDTFYFPSTVPHSYRNPGTTVTRVLWTNTPPTF
ncbi:cupin domain-containing protein [Caballeronia sp. dw_276]|uniref:cupin domain-containing protein n=1 Tax=Caballeronia sp. dw_276 TaxID=2719795 RepID=UPI001BD4BB74